MAALRIARLRPAHGDLAGLRVVDPATASVFRVYHDGASEAAARAAIPDLHAMYLDIAERTAADPGRIDWSAVAFVADPDYVPPRREGEVRWVVPTELTGSLGRDGERMLYVTVPHEQVHAVHGSFLAAQPRWFSEGLATWVGLQVTARRHPQLAAEELDALQRARAAAPDSLDLRGWGGIRVKREAILRQLTPEQRERAESDPTYVPPGPFRFGPEDMESDERHAQARYAAARLIFETVAQRHGRAALHAWLGDVWNAGPDAIDTDGLVRLAAARGIAVDVDNEEPR